MIQLVRIKLNKSLWMETTKQGSTMKKLIAIAILLGSTGLLAKPITLESVSYKEPTFKVTPQFGVMKIKGDYLDENSTISTGAAIDFMLSRRFSVGVNFTYSLFELDYAYNEMDLKQYDLGIFTKFFIIPDGVVRPFIGTGVSYIHNKMEYADDAYNTNVPYYNSDYYTFGTVAGTVAVGSEIRFSRNIGLVIDGRFTQNFTSGLNRQYENSTNSIYGYAPLAMENMEYNLEDAYSLSVNAGLVISF